MSNIDGSHGEGGGQILRSALALSMVTGRPFRIEKIRSGRRRPGLMRQHLTAVNAAASICNAQVQGATLGSGELNFVPGEIKGGEYHFSVGTAGSTMLVLQTVLLPLLFADAPSTLRVSGGTHARNAPPYDFLERVYVPLLEQMGAEIGVKLTRYGFFPAGGGEVVAEISPLPGGLQRLELTERGDLQHRSLRVVSAFLPDHVGLREVEAFCEVADWPADVAGTEQIDDANSAGNIMMAELSFATHRELFSETGKPGKPAEEVARGCAEQVLEFLQSHGAVGEHLCDQLLLPMALGRGGRFTTAKLTGHSRTQVWLIPQFMNVEITVDEDKEFVEVCVEPGADRIGN